MKFFCDQCNAQYMIADEKVGPRGVKVKCKKCSHIIVVKPASEAAPPAPEPSADSDAGAAAGGSEFGGDKTMVGMGLPALQPSNEKVDAELSGAFESLLAESSAGASQPNPEAAASGSPGMGAGESGGDVPAAPASGGEKVWYVAVDDRQVGPIDVQELTRMWQEGRIKDESLGWRAGMPDWVALVDIPELQAVANGMGPRAAKAEAADAVAGSTTAKPAAVEWKPSAASALSSLVQEELIASATPKEETAKPPTGVPDLGFSGYASGDLFGGQVQGPPPPGAEAPGAAPQWSVPQSKPKSRGLVYVFGGITAGVLLLAGIMVFMVVRSRESNAPPPRATTAAAPPAAAPPAAAPPATANNAPAAAPAQAPAAPAAPAAPPAAPAAPPVKEAAADRDDEQGPRRRGKRGAARAERGGRGGRERPAAVAAAEPGGNVKVNLNADDVRGGVRQYAAKAIPCLRAARSRNEIGPGDYTFTLDWVIQPDGSVRSPELKSPAAVLDTSLPACFQAAMSQWRFPASQNGAPVRNFPFGPVKIP